MKLIMTGDGPGNHHVFVESDGKRSELRTVTRVIVDPDGARLEAYVPELDVTIGIPEATGNALLELDRLRERNRQLEQRNGELERLARGQEAGIRERNAEIDEWRRYVAAAKKAARGIVSGEPLADFITRTLENVEELKRILDARDNERE